MFKLWQLVLRTSTWANCFQSAFSDLWIYSPHLSKVPPVFGVHFKSIYQWNSIVETSNASRRRKKEVTPPTYMIPPTRFSQDFGYQHSSICTPPPTLFAPPSKFSIPQAFLHDPAPFTNDSLRGHDQVHQTRSTLPDFNLSKHSKGKIFIVGVEVYC